MYFYTLYRFKQYFVLFQGTHFNFSFMICYKCYDNKLFFSSIKYLLYDFSFFLTIKFLDIILNHTFVYGF